jgi:hypothetical protein
MNGPSVTRVSPSRTRTVVAVSAGCSWFAPTNAPDARSASVKAMYSGIRSSPTSDGSSLMRSRYCMSSSLGSLTTV